jgi:TPR repeat protein
MAEATQALERTDAVLQDSSAPLSSEMMTVLVFYHAVLRQDAEKAREWWERAVAKKPSVVESSSCSLCALLLAEGRWAEANAAWETGSAWAQKLPVGGAGDLERDAAALLRRRLDASRLSEPMELSLTGAGT